MHAQPMMNRCGTCGQEWWDAHACPKQQPPMALDGFFSEAKRLNLRMLGTPEEIRAALDLKDAEIARLRSESERMRRALERVAKWHGEFPPTGKTWPTGEPMSYGAANGSNGERDYMRALAREALVA